MQESTHIPGAGNGGQADRVQNTCAIQTRKLSQYMAKSAGKSNRINFLGGNFPQDSLYLDISFFVNLRTMSSKNISETLSFVPDIESAEKLLHEVETTASFVVYYSYGVGKGKS